MRPGDIARVLEIESVVFTNPWQETDFLYSMGKPSGDCLVAEVDGRLTGYSVGFRVDGEYHLADFAVRPERQREGLGSALLEQLLERLGDTDTGYVSLEVRMSNTAAIGLYTRYGFDQVAIRSAYYLQPIEDALVMLKVLSGELSDWLPATPSA